MKDSVRVAFYARVSSQKQSDNNTIDSQCEALRKRIENDGFTFPSEYAFCDDGYSGSELMRPALEKLRDRVYACLIDKLYIHSPDRLSRKMAHQAILLEEFAKHRCEVIFLNQVGLPESPESNLLIQMQGMIAEYEREKILERTRRGRRYAAALGNVSVFGGAPYGYQYIKKQCVGGAARWEVDPITSEHVKLIFDLVGNRGYTLNAVVRELRSRQIETSTGKLDWISSTLRGILTNTSYHGEARYGKKRLVPRKPGKRPSRGHPEVSRYSKVGARTELSEQFVVMVPAIVDRPLFERVAITMDENLKRQRERLVGTKFLLSGTLICGQCGSAYCARARPNGKHQYRCIGNDKFRCGEREKCTNTSIYGVELESTVWLELCKLLQEPNRLRQELENNANDPQYDQKLKALQQELKTYREQLDRLIDAYTIGHIEKAEFEKRIGPVRARNARQVAIVASMQKNQHDSTDVTAAQESLSQLAAEVETQLATADWTLQRSLVKLLIKRIEVHANEIRIVYKVPQVPFFQSPDNRGILQHRVSCQAATVLLHRRQQTDPIGPIFAGVRSVQKWSASACRRIH